MATLTVEVGPLSASRSINDATAQLWIENILRRHEGEEALQWSNQDKLDWFVKLLAQDIKQRALEYQKRVRRQSTDIEVEQEFSDDWTTT